MTENQKYTAAVAEGNYPLVRLVPKGNAFIDDRGKIENVLLEKIASVARITSKRGTVRANHFHETDWHYAYVESGSVLYFERRAGEKLADPIHYRAGDTFFTPPRVEHAMLFAEDSVIWTFAKNVRTHENHEEDVVRVTMVTPEIAARYVLPVVPSAVSAHPVSDR